MSESFLAAPESHFRAAPHVIQLGGGDGLSLPGRRPGAVKREREDSLICRGLPEGAGGGGGGFPGDQPMARPLSPWPLPLP